MATEAANDARTAAAVGSPLLPDDGFHLLIVIWYVLWRCSLPRRLISRFSKLDFMIALVDATRAKLQICMSGTTGIVSGSL